MKTVLYYFSATGNALAVAKGIRERMGDCELISVPQALSTMAEDEKISAQVVGIVAPIYMHNMPHMVARFIERIRDPEYLFMVYAGGGELGAGVGKSRKQFARNGLTLSALFNLAMPSNYTPYGYPEESEQAELLRKAEGKIDSIAETAKGRSLHFDDSGTSFIKAHIFPGPLYQLGYRHIATMDRGFAVDDRCTSCGICEQLCPTNNISMLDGRPVWNHQCEQCFGCLQWCPAEAIEYGKRTRGVPRYQHPEITLQEIKKGAPSV